MTLLTVAGLHVRGPEGRDLVSDVSFTLDAGERLGLIGESGSGKSMTALAIMGLTPPGMTVSGSVVFDAPGLDRSLDRTEVVGAGSGGSPRCAAGRRARSSRSRSPPSTRSCGWAARWPSRSGEGGGCADGPCARR
ncbi:hypothetical protein GCM10027612_06310 [Microbispora bryophytorum subsp. camponoti]